MRQHWPRGIAPFQPSREPTAEFSVHRPVSPITLWKVRNSKPSLVSYFWTACHSLFHSDIYWALTVCSQCVGAEDAKEGDLALRGPSVQWERQARPGLTSPRAL